METKKKVKLKHHLIIPNIKLNINLAIKKTIKLKFIMIRQLYVIKLIYYNLYIIICCPFL